MPRKSRNSRVPVSEVFITEFVGRTVHQGRLADATIVPRMGRGRAGFPSARSSATRFGSDTHESPRMMTFNNGLRREDIAEIYVNGGAGASHAGLAASALLVSSIRSFHDCMQNLYDNARVQKSRSTRLHESLSQGRGISRANFQNIWIELIALETAKPLREACSSTGAGHGAWEQSP